MASNVRGCNSDPYPVTATIINYEPAEIRIVYDSTLGSNYVSNNVWMFYSDTIKSANGQYLQLQNPGIYTLVTDTLGCRSTASFAYLPLETEQQQNDLYAYPNPASDVLVVGTGTFPTGTIAVVDALGRVVMRNERSPGGNEQSIIVRGLAEGIYYVMLASPGRNQIIRFIKED